MQEVKNRLHVKKLGMNSNGVYIMKWPQSKIRQLTQQRFFIIKVWKGQNIRIQVMSQKK